MKLASLKQHAVFNGIVCIKMAAEQYKVVLVRVVTYLTDRIYLRSTHGQFVFQHAMHHPPLNL
ncbi:hypothetical protein C5745_00050 [Sphingobacterium haloxyli]|uniref:Uncharacterized protein n=1 Tax=Sphingobacterium haloxyli TaxID=2100533 RepID=A0A2S9J8L6_9SPHI|nr:hypothetical protein C5745_00050 [Sphingobacterium haloxyli]